MICFLNEEIGGRPGSVPQATAAGWRKTFPFEHMHGILAQLHAPVLTQPAAKLLSETSAEIDGFLSFTSKIGHETNKVIKDL